MPNQRAPGQKLLPIAVDETFLKELDAGMVQAGYRNRSQFIRDAIVEKLMRGGISLPKELALPPQRSKKGGPGAAKLRYPPPQAASYALNEKPTPKNRKKT